MITFKCKMCGGDLEFEQGASVAECPYCGTTQTLPKLDDDKRANMYDRANHFRRQNEYDKAMAIYEQILAEDRTDAEAYWSLVLCRYGIEYVEDPVSHKRVPTVNRAQYASILADEDYKSALTYADTLQSSVYEAEANAIAEIQKGILDISKKEEPFDVFICYKETDANGRRTPDSVLANDMYHQLTKEGFKVFFSRITLEDKIGTAYEPYIFAALNSAKVMVVLGTKPEYFNAVWVKNEWSRYLALIRGGADKTLVPAYRDMDPYDLPEEFAHLQAQDMGKLGFMQDLIRGIKKILQKDAPKPQTVIQQTVAAPVNNVTPLLERAFMFLEDGDFARADEFCEQVLNLDPKNGKAYLGKLMAELKVRREGDLKNQSQPFDGNGNYQKVLRFGDEALKAQLKADIEFITKRNEHARQKGIFDNASDALQKATTVDQCLDAMKQLKTIPGFEGVKERIADCNAKIESINAASYQKAAALQAAGKWQQAIGGYNALKGFRDSRERIAECEEGIRADAFQSATALKDNRKWREAIAAFEKLGDYRDSRKQAEHCRDAQEAERRAEEANRERERREAEARAKAEAAKRRARTIVAILLVAVIAAGAFLYIKVIKPNGIYNSAIKALEAGNYDEAISAFSSLGEYKDAAARVGQAQADQLFANGSYSEALKVYNTFDAAYRTHAADYEQMYTDAAKMLTEGDYDGATAAFQSISGYNDADTQAQESQYQKGVALLASGDYDGATTAFESVSSYNDAATQAQESQYQKGTALLLASDYDRATTAFKSISRYKDADTQAKESQYQKGMALLLAGDYDGATTAFKSISGYKDADTQAKESQYQKGTALLAADDYDSAAVVFQSISGYNDANVQRQESQYRKGMAFLNADEEMKALIAFRTINGYKDSAKYVKSLEEKNSKNQSKLACGKHHFVGLNSDGTAIAIGDNDDRQCNVSDWHDIVAISAGYFHTIGLKSDTTVIAVGYKKNGQCEVGEWRDIISVSGGYTHTVGLKSDGTVVTVGENDNGQCNVSEWHDIIAISADSRHTFGLKSDGTVVATGDNDYGECDINDWHDIVAISSSSVTTVGLKADGTVVATGANDCGQCDVLNWHDIVAISESGSHTVGLKSDGKVVAVGRNKNGECEVEDWTDIVAIATGDNLTIGLKSDGQVVSAGKNIRGLEGLHININ